MIRLPRSIRLRVPTTLAAIALLAVAAVAVLRSPSAAGEAPPPGRVVPPDLFAVEGALLAARHEELLAIRALQDLRSGAADGETARADAEAHVTASLGHLDAAQDAVSAFATSLDSAGYLAEFPAALRRMIEDIRPYDDRTLDRLDDVPSRRRARGLISDLEEALRLKSSAILFAVGVPWPEVRRTRIDAATGLPETPATLDDLGLAVRSQGMYGLRYTFDARRVAGTGFVPIDRLFANFDVLHHTLSDDVPGASAGGRRGPGQRFLAFRGAKKSMDGQAYLTLQNPLVGPFQAEFSAGVFRRARKRHWAFARVSVEFDVEGSDPLDFFVVSTRYVPEDKGTATPAGVQVFTGSTGGMARGDLFLPGSDLADVRVVFENGRFDVAARPFGGAEEDYAAVGSWMHGDMGESWALGVGASSLRKGTELGIDDLMLTPR